MTVFWRQSKNYTLNLSNAGIWSKDVHWDGIEAKSFTIYNQKLSHIQSWVTQEGQSMVALSNI